MIVHTLKKLGMMFPDREGLLNGRLELIELGADQSVTAVSTGMAVIASLPGVLHARRREGEAPAEPNPCHEHRADLRCSAKKCWQWLTARTRVSRPGRSFALGW
jgi:hypothetical protein